MNPTAAPQQPSTAEEQQRMARELYDVITQTLFSLSLIAEALPEMWENDQEEGRRLLTELQQLSRGALADARSLLLELNRIPPAESEIGDPPS